MRVAVDEFQDELKNKTMPTYVYETIPSQPGEEPRRFEVQQRMTEPALEIDPESGLPVRRVISGGLEIPRAPTDKPRKPTKPQSGHPSSCSCCRPGIRPKY